MAYLPCPYCDLAPRSRNFAAHLAAHRKAGDAKREAVASEFLLIADAFRLLAERIRTQGLSADDAARAINALRHGT
jgi:hypothetical protein